MTLLKRSNQAPSQLQEASSAASDGDQDPVPQSLLGLPSEIRVMIYEYLLPERIIIRSLLRLHSHICEATSSTSHKFHTSVKCVSWTFDKIGRKGRAEWVKNLMLVSRTLATDLQPLLYGVLRFRAKPKPTSNMVCFFNQFPQIARHVKELILDPSYIIASGAIVSELDTTLSNYSGLQCIRVWHLEVDVTCDGVRWMPSQRCLDIIE